MLKNQKGFTLIELVMIIVILGILAAVAIPRYLSLQGDARTATINGMAGTVRGASAIVHAAAIIRGQLGAAGTVTLEGGTVVDTVNGYPAATAAGIGTAVQFDAADFTTAAGPPYLFQKVGATTPATCAVSYAASVAGAPPVITVLTAGCP